MLFRSAFTSGIEPALWGERARPRDAHNSSRAADRGGPDGELHTGATRNESRSAGGAAIRVGMLDCGFRIAKWQNLPWKSEIGNGDW